MSKRNRSRSQSNGSFDYQNLEPRKLMAAGAFSGFFDGHQITFDNGTTAEINQPGAQVVMGDWNGDGNETPGVFREGNWILDQTGNGLDPSDKQISFGWPTDIPVAGDWDGDGVDTVGAFRDGAWYQDHDGDGYTHIRDDFPVWFGLPGDVPVAGNWDGDAAGTDSPGVFRNGTWILDQTGNGYDNLDPVIGFGAADAQPFAADWNGDGRDTPGVLQAEGWYFREGNGYVGFMNTPLQFVHNQGTPLSGNGLMNPIANQGIDLGATSVAYNPQGPESQRATVNMHIHNPQQVDADVLVALVWASTPDGDAPFKEVAGVKLFNASGANNSGHVSIDFSADELSPRPAQAKYLIAVVNADQAVSEDNFANNFAETEIERRLYLNFDGIDLSRSQLESWAGNDWRHVLDAELDSDHNGIEVESFFDGHANRNEIVRGIHYRIQQDLAPFGITVQLTGGGAVADEGATTIFFGANSIGPTGANIASDIDYYNDNRTDIGFVTPYDLGDIQQTIFANADIALHEAGHTYGLHHVYSGNLPETMGYVYSTGSLATHDTGYLDYTFSEYVDEDGVDHSGAFERKSQNSFRRIAESFGYLPLDRSGPEPSVFGNGNLNALSDAEFFSHYDHQHSFNQANSQNDQPGHGPNCGCPMCQISEPASVQESQPAERAFVADVLLEKENNNEVKAATTPVNLPVVLELMGSTEVVDETVTKGYEDEGQSDIDLSPSSLDQLFANFDEFEQAVLV